MLKINEIFYSLSGEISKLPQGTPTIFIRLSGCNLKCKWCDTDYSSYVLMKIEDVIENIKEWDCKNIIITGGEPLLQKEDVFILCYKLRQVGYFIMIETNGSINPNVRVDYWMMDYKLQYKDKMVLDHFRFGRKQGLVKIIIVDQDEFNEAVSIFYQIQANKPEIDFLFCLGARSPLNPQTLAQWILKESTQITLNTQLHKILTFS